MTGDALFIRGAKDQDYDRFIESLDAWWGGRTMTAMLPRLYFQHFGPWTFVAEVNGLPVGFLAAFRSQADETVAYCHFVGVSPEARGQGVGEALYNRLFVDAAAAGCLEVQSVTSPLNAGSIAFHRRLGFEPLPGSGAVDGTPYTADYDGPGEDRVRFSRSLRLTGGRCDGTVHD